MLAYTLEDFTTIIIFLHQHGAVCSQIVPLFLLWALKPPVLPSFLLPAGHFQLVLSPLLLHIHLFWKGFNQ
jgi:hypothetical protein